MISKILIGAKKSIPIGLAFFPFAFTLGLISKGFGISILEITLMNIFIYAGSSEVIILQLLGQNAKVLQIIIAAAIVNLRYSLINLAIIKKQTKFRLLPRIFSTIFLTDETVSYLSLTNTYDVYETLGFGICAYMFFAFFSIIGYIAGEFVSPEYVDSLGFVLYAVFIYLLMQVVMTNKKYILVVITTVSVKFILNYIGLASYITMLLSIILGCLIPIIIKEKFNVKI